MPFSQANETIFDWSWIRQQRETIVILYNNRFSNYTVNHKIDSQEHSCSNPFFVPKQYSVVELQILNCWLGRNSLLPSLQKKNNNNKKQTNKTKREHNKRPSKQQQTVDGLNASPRRSKWKLTLSWSGFKVHFANFKRKEKQKRKTYYAKDKWTTNKNINVFKQNPFQTCQKMEGVSTSTLLYWFKDSITSLLISVSDYVSLPLAIYTNLKSQSPVYNTCTYSRWWFCFCSHYTMIS